jgi:hypothetical protein
MAGQSKRFGRLLKGTGLPKGLAARRQNFYSTRSMKHRAALLIAVFALLAAIPAFADGADPLSLIGLDLKAATDSLGLPQEMFPFRGTEEARDSVVFYYGDHSYLFWFKGRVWQVRYDRRYTGPVLGFALGMTRGQAQAAAATLLSPNGDSLYFDINDRAYPVRVRLLFAADVVTDIYIYRSDF